MLRSAGTYVAPANIFRQLAARLASGRISMSADIVNNKSRNLRAANRNTNTTDNRNGHGFRVARTFCGRSGQPHAAAGRAVNVQGKS